MIKLYHKSVLTLHCSSRFTRFLPWENLTTYRKSSRTTAEQNVEVASVAHLVARGKLFAIKICKCIRA